MYKITFNLGIVRHFGVPPKILLIMKLVIIIMITCLVQVSAASFGQTLTYSKKGATLNQIFNAIKSQTGYNLFFSNEMVDKNKKIDVNFHNTALGDVMNELSIKSELEYKIDDRNISVKPKTPSFLDRLVERFANIDVRGKILDEKGEPLVGATVAVMGKNRSVKTDQYGAFYLENVGESDKLVISFIGYQNKEVDAASDMGSLRMVVADQGLEEVNVVSTGYQTLPKERATGSFSTVGNRLFNQQVSTNVLERLEATASGVAIDRSTGTSAGRLMIRGLSTLGGPRGALIILDNNPYEGDVSNINPNDIENITILKDAAAASIWGARAGNGVIVITTKKGKFEQPLSIDFNVNSTIGAKPNLGYIKQMSSTDFIDVEKMLYEKDYYSSQISSTDRPALSPVVELLIQRNTVSPAEQSAIDQQIEQFRRYDVRGEFRKYFYQPSVNQQYALNLNGGTEHHAWLISGGFDHNKSNLDDLYQRLNLRGNHNLKFSKKLSLSTNLLFTQGTAESGKPGFGQITTLGNSALPYTRFADDSGNAVPMIKDYRASFLQGLNTPGLSDWNYYPFTDYQHNNSKSELQDIVLNAALDYKIIPELNSAYNISMKNRPVMVAV